MKRTCAVPEALPMASVTGTGWLWVASEVLGIDPSGVTLIHGDTSLTPYSTGTYASRSIVMAGGAVARACRVLPIG